MSGNWCGIYVRQDYPSPGITIAPIGAALQVISDRRRTRFPCGAQPPSRPLDRSISSGRRRVNWCGAQKLVVGGFTTAAIALRNRSGCCGLASHLAQINQIPCMIAITILAPVAGLLILAMLWPYGPILEVLSAPIGASLAALCIAAWIYHQRSHSVLRYSLRRRRVLGCLARTWTASAHA